MRGEDWVKDALEDDSMVAELLMRLKVGLPPLASAPPPRRTSPALRLHWSVRQPRSKPAGLRLTESKKENGNNADVRRASPTTPLSWSATTSASGGGSVTSSRPDRPSANAARSKVAAVTETTPTKRPRRKKTLAELKEEESLLSRERKELKHELAALRLTVERERATNECLKRMKIDLLPLTTKTAPIQTTSEEAKAPDESRKAPCEPTPSSLATSITAKDLDSSCPSLPNSSSEVNKGMGSNQHTMFQLPDLNLPLEGDSGCEILHGMS
ncbi:uncharacterized protein LOC131157844 [Malania oleifera]|uniref:uncharacterized protein LOC131157844 n=1 Tax=Malania oleifera TaxID=397392 RepID=UPI0025AEBF11|nr:uncharacterized protein LOC131157844 [Malania oleifera]